MGSTVQAGDLRQILGTMGGAAFLGAAAAGSTPTAINANNAFSTPAAGNYVGGVLRFVTGALAGQEQPISANTSTAFTVSAFTAAPGAGDLFVVQKIEVQATVTENVGQVGGVAVPILDVPRVPVVSSNAPQTISAVVPGAIGADGNLLSAVYPVPANGSIVLAVTLASAATSSVLTVSRNANAGTPFYGQLNNGNALAALNEFDANIPVHAGDIVQFQLVTATTLAMSEFSFVAEQ